MERIEGFTKPTGHYSFKGCLWLKKQKDSEKQEESPDKE